MKKFLFITTAILTAFLIGSCSKDDSDNGNTTDNNVKLVRQIKYTNGYKHSGTSSLQTISYEYDSQNRITKCSSLLHSDYLYNFIYEGNSLIIESEDKSYQYQCKLNSDGYITELIDVKYEEKVNFTYNNGYLIYGELFSDQRTKTYKQSWQDGNITHIDDGYEITFSYSPHKNVPINLDLIYLTDDYGFPYGDYFGFLGFFGRQNNYLPARSDDFDDANFVYEFNEDGTVAKVIYGNVYMELYY